jgi:hypothetical protein
MLSRGGRPTSEGVGVKPDIDAPAKDALNVAQRIIPKDVFAGECLPIT